MRFRRRLVGSAVGRLAMRSRSALEYWRTSPEAIGTLANDQLAEFLVTRLCERSFVDVGAHIGSIIAEVQKHCPQVQITAFEPVPEKARWLRNRFKEVEVVECALADYQGETSFFVNLVASGYSSLAQSSDGMTEIRVPVRRLDAVVADADVVKIDVEGAELGVLRGSERINGRPVIMFESAPGEVLGYTKADLWSWFEEHEYGVLLPNRLAHTAPPMTLEVFMDSHQYPRHTTNYFAVPVEKIERVREKARRLLRL